MKVGYAIHILINAKESSKKYMEGIPDNDDYLEIEKPMAIEECKIEIEQYQIAIKLLQGCNTIRTLDRAIKALKREKNVIEMDMNKWWEYNKKKYADTWNKLKDHIVELENAINLIENNKP